MADKTELGCGLMVWQGNRLEDLRDLVLGWLARQPLAPLENDVFLVQSQGMGQWLKLALAGESGVSAAVSMQLPAQFLWRAYRRVLGEAAVPERSALDREALIWRILRLLPTLQDQPVFAPLQHFLRDDGDGRKRYQLAGKLAELFDQYQVYRADWLLDWQAGADQLRLAPDAAPSRAIPTDQLWQPALWRAVLADIAAQGGNPAGRASIHRQFVDALAGLAARPAGLPRRVVVFGISSLPQQVIEALAALGQHSQVVLVAHNPCQHYWGDLTDRQAVARRLARRRPQARLPALDSLHADNQPLLAAWGRHGRDFLGLLDRYDQPEDEQAALAGVAERIDLFIPPSADTLLGQLQHGMFDLTPPPATPAERLPVAAEDLSVRFHLAHSRQREVEILHDQLLAYCEAAQAAGTPLAPRDMVVMVPDVAAYAPHVRAVFGRIPPGDPRHLPFTLADRSVRDSAPLLRALDTLLASPHARFTVSEVFDLLDAPALARRFDLPAETLPRLRQWAEQSGIRWGLDAGQRARLALPDGLQQNSWQFGLERLLLGYAVGDGDAWQQRIQPCDEAAGLEVAALGPLAQLIDRLRHWAGVLTEPASPRGWGERLRQLLADFLLPVDDQERRILLRLDSALASWLEACADAGLDDALPLAVVREAWLGGLDDAAPSQHFLAGAVNVCTLMPMRAIPFRVVCLLGMNDGDYPRRQPPSDFDLMAQPGHARPGDRARRDDDRYLLLEALLSARERLYISWVGRNARDNSPQPPSVLIGQLRDVLAAGWRLAGDDPQRADSGARLLAALTCEHPLQPFSPRYFATPPAAGLFTYAHEWRAAHHAAAPAEATLPALLAPSPATLTLADLTRFLRRPVAHFFARRLRVQFDAGDDSLLEHEPFTLNGLDSYALRERLLHALRRGTRDGQDLAKTLAAEAGRWQREGLMPLQAGATLFDGLAAQVAPLWLRWQALRARWPQALPPAEVTLALAGSVQLEDWVGERYATLSGEHTIRLLALPHPLRHSQGWRLERLLAPWLTHLALNASGQPTASWILASDDDGDGLHWPAWPVAEAQARLDRISLAWLAGLAGPLPLACKTLLAYLQHLARQTDRGGEVNDDAAWQHASQVFAGGWQLPGEVDGDPCLARAFPDWPAFSLARADACTWAEQLYLPLLRATLLPPEAA